MCEIVMMNYSILKMSLKKYINNITCTVQNFLYSSEFVSVGYAFFFCNDGLLYSPYELAKKVFIVNVYISFSLDLSLNIHIQ